MHLQTLVTTFHKTEDEIRELVVHNNLQGEVLFGDQCGKNEIKDLGLVGKAHVILYFFDTIGLSNNRNSLFKAATADYVSFADDDIVFIDNYPAIVEEDLKRLNNPDMIRYNIASTNPQRSISQIKKEKQIGFHDVSKYGVWGFFFKRDFLLNNGLTFRPELGPGQKRSHGEDTVYLKDFMDQKQKSYQIPLVLGKTDMDHSSWYGQDVRNDIVTDGYVYRLNRKKIALLFGYYRYLAHRNFFPNVSFHQFVKLYKQGMKEADAAKKPSED